MVALVLLVLVAGMGLAPASLRADPGAPDAIHLDGCIAPVRAGDVASRMFVAATRFDCQRPATSWGPGSYWVRYQLPPAAFKRELQPRHFSFVPHWQRLLTIYTKDVTGRVVATSLDNRDISRDLRVAPFVGVKLRDNTTPLVSILVRVDGALNVSGLLGSPQLLSGPELHGEELVAAVIFAAFGGLAIGLFCYNIVLWLTIRERFQLTYCLSLLAMIAYIWASSGTMAVQFSGISQTLRLQTCYLMLAFVAALALQFITDFIEHDRLPPRLRAFARHVGLGCIGTAFAVCLAPPEWRWLADRAYVLSFIPLPPVVVAVTWIAWRRGSNSVRVLAIAWAVPLAMAILRIAHSLHYVEFGLVVQYALVVAMSMEALLSSLAMSFRIKLLTDERDRAVADEQTARYLASVDSLTGLLNRRALLEQVIAWRSPEPLRLLLVDIDRFKLINDRFGHLVGDEVLRDVAEVLAMRADLRGSVARLGGEEFALIGTVDELTEAVALGILADMRARSMAGHVRLTVSIGIAEGMVQCEDDWRELYRRADAALYDAKSQGRNRIVHAASDQSDAWPVIPLAGHVVVM